MWSGSPNPQMVMIGSGVRATVWAVRFDGKGGVHTARQEVAGVEALVRLDPNDAWTRLTPESVGDLIHDAYVDPEDFALTGGVASVVGELTWGKGACLYRSALSMRMPATELHLIDDAQVGVHCIQDVLVIGDGLQFLWPATQGRRFLRFLTPLRSGGPANPAPCASGFGEERAGEP